MADDLPMDLAAQRRPNPLPEPNFEGSEWQTADTSWMGLRNRPGIAGWWYANRAEREVFPGKRPDFLLSCTSLPADVDYGTDGPEWRPVRLLGSGTYGAAGLWQRIDEDGKVFGEVVIKQQQRDGDPGIHHRHLDVPGRPGLLNEAVIQRDLNRLPESININHLYGFKFNTALGIQRFYMINNPHQDLWLLKLKYGVYGSYMPELFLWTLFVSLLQALALMEIDPRDRTIAGMVPPGSTDGEPPYLLHLDWKHNNIFLDYEIPSQDKNELWSQYPIVRVGDFGLACYTHAKDAANPNPKLQWRSCKYWKPPEMIDWKQYDKYAIDGQTLHPEDKTVAPSPLTAAQQAARTLDLGYKTPPNKDDEKYRPSLNTWCVGKIMFDLCTMWHDSMSQIYMDLIDEELYDYFGEHFIPEKEGLESLLGSNQEWSDAKRCFPYSDRLQSLIRSCLSPDANQRPRTEDALRAATQGRDDLAAQLWKDSDEGEDEQYLKQETKLYFKENDINSMTPGQARFPGYEAETYRMAKHHDDPDWDELKWPENRHDIRHEYRMRHSTVIQRNGNLYWGRDLTEARKAAEKGERELTTTRDQWMAKNFGEVLDEAARWQSWDEDKLRRRFKKHRREELIDRFRLETNRQGSTGGGDAPDGVMPEEAYPVPSGLPIETKRMWDPSLSHDNGPDNRAAGAGEGAAPTSNSQPTGPLGADPALRQEKYPSDIEPGAAAPGPGTQPSRTASAAKSGSGVKSPAKGAKTAQTSGPQKAGSGNSKSSKSGTKKNTTKRPGIKKAKTPRPQTQPTRKSKRLADEKPEYGLLA